MEHPIEARSCVLCVLVPATDPRQPARRAGAHVAFVPASRGPARELLSR